MKMTPAWRIFWSGIVFAVLAFVSGCATTPPPDWNARIGHCTYNEAASELGPPARQVKLGNGQTEYRWFMHPSRGASYNAGVPSTMNSAIGANPTFGPNYDDRVLTLTFDSNGVLTAWSKNY